MFLEDEEKREKMTQLVNAVFALSDPFAADLMYHHNCWRENIEHVSQKSTHLQNVTLKEARSLFFKHVDNVIFGEHEIRSLQSLLSDYKVIVSEYGYPVGNIKSSYVKQILINEYGSDIGFKERAEKNKSDWVYDCKGGGDYIQCAVKSMGISDAQLLKNAAPRLTKSINSVPTIAWPPTVEELEVSEDISPLLLLLLTWLRNPTKGTADLSPETLSMASLLSYYVTGKRTATAINLGITVHGMTRSRELSDILHKSVKLISYADIQLLYDYWALQDAEASDTCPQALADGKPGIAIMDNDDFPFDSLSGSAEVAHRTNVMHVQPVEYEKRNTSRPSLVKKKEITKKLNDKCESLTKVDQYKCPRTASKEPPIRSFVEAPVDSTKPQRIRSVIHALARSSDSCDRPLPKDQKVPSYSGFQSCLAEALKKSKPYYQASYPEPPSKSVCHDVMIKLVNAMKEKNIPFFFLVGDLPTYKEILSLKSENPELFKDIIPTIGTFHQQMSYIYAIYKRFQGSGIEDILVSAGVLAGGSVEKALKGKHYRRAVRSILIWREALFHLRLKELLKSKLLSAEAKAALAILRNPLNETKESLAKANDLLEGLDEIQELVSQVYSTPGTEMGDFWLSFLVMTDPLSQNIHACHTQSYKEFKSSTYEMLNGMASYNQTDYTRYLSDFWAMIENLNEDQTAFFESHFVQSLSGLPYSAMPLDMWIEVTMNLCSKLKAGWLCLLQNEKQLFITARNANNVSRVKSVVKKKLKTKVRDRKHAECQPARMKKDEQAVTDILATLTQCDAHLFDEQNPVLRSIQSGILATPEVKLDFSLALHEGKNGVETLLSQRVFSKNKNLLDPIPRNKRLNFENMTVIKQTSKSLTYAKMEQAGLAAAVELAEGVGALSVEEILEFRLTDECLSMYYADGSQRKPAKSKLLEHLNLNTVVNIPTEYSSLVDMGFIWRLATPTAEDRERVRRDGRSYLWLDYLEKVVSLVLSRHPAAITTILVNDIYNKPISIKDEEHERRAAKYIGAGNKFPKPRDPFPSPSEYNAFLSVSGNKTYLQSLIKNHLLQKNLNRQIVYCEGNVCTAISSNSELPHLALDHTEADTMMLTIYSIIRQDNPDLPIVIDSEDTDVYVQAAYVAHHVPGDLLIKRKDGLLNCKDLADEEISDIVIAAHCITGCDHTSGQYGHGKKQLMKKLKADPEARELLSSVGMQASLSDETHYDMEQFILTKSYGCLSGSTCAEARAQKWRKQKKKNTLLLPPDSDSLYHHLQRANYLTYCLKNFELREHPSPIMNGWKLENGKCRVVRYTRGPLPECDNYFRDTSSSDSDSETDTECESSTDSSSDSDTDIRQE